MGFSLKVYSGSSAVLCSIALVCAVVVWGAVVRGGASESRLCGQDGPVAYNAISGGAGLGCTDSGVSKSPPLTLGDSSRHAAAATLSAHSSKLMDPNDPGAWLSEGNSELPIATGNMDPDDPATWPVQENSELPAATGHMDPDDPATWPVQEDSELPEATGQMDPDDPSTWPAGMSVSERSVTGYADPDDPSTWRE